MITSTPYHRGGGGDGADEDESMIVGSGQFGRMGPPPSTIVSSRTRQSYMYPMQRTFEETRSMLMNEGMPSIFETTLQSAKVPLPLGGMEDFIGAMDNLHERFAVVIDCMTDRSQIFEVISAWIQDIEFAVQHKRTNETDLSEIQCRKLTNLLRLESETWNLISQLYFQRLNEEETVEPFNEKIEDQYCINEEPYVSAIVETSTELKEMISIVNWLEANFEKFGPPDLSEKDFIWENTLEALKRDKLTGKHSMSSMVTSVHPDAPSKQQRQLHPLDQEENTKVLKGAFYYIRTGQLDNAIAYLSKSGDKIKASALTGQQYTAKVQIDEETGEQREAQNHTVIPPMEYRPSANLAPRPPAKNNFNIRGNPKRDLWKLITWKVCENNTMAKYDRALLGSVSGHQQAMLDVANTWEDRLWAFLKASIDVSVEERLRILSVPNNRKPLPTEYWDQKLSVDQCISKVDAFDKAGSCALPEAVFQSLQKHVMMNKMEDFIKELHNYLIELLKSFDHPLLNSHLVRFFTHLLLFLGVVDLPFTQDLIDICMEQYVSVLVDINLISRTPYYLQKLSDDKQIPTIVRHIGSERHFKRDEILEFLKGAQGNELDVLGIGIAVVDKMRDEEDDFAVENLDWISCCYGIAENSAQVMYEFLKYTIWLSRKYLTLGRIEKVKQLIDQVSPDNVAEVVQISETLENTLVREYICYKVYLEAEDALALWQKALSQRPDTDIGVLPTAATKADRNVYEKRKKEAEALQSKWSRAVDFHLSSAIEKFFNILKFPIGWLRECYDTQDEDEANRVGAARRIIIRKVITILMRLIKDKNDNRTIRDFLYIISDDNRNVLCELPTAEVGNISLLIENFTRNKVSNIMFLPK